MVGYDQHVSSLVMDYEAMVDHGSAVAPYRQIAAILRGRIESGEYGPGQRLPGINDLMQEFGVAHLTANKALRALVAEGLAELSPGRGFYVTAPGEGAS
jgi:DNA-binding GntR family transcriptional regulator